MHRRLFLGASLFLGPVSCVGSAVPTCDPRPAAFISARSTFLDAGVQAVIALVYG